MSFKDFLDDKKDSVIFHLSLQKCQESLFSIAPLCQTDKNMFDSLSPFIKQNIEIMQYINKKCGVFPDGLIKHTIPSIFHHLI